MASEPNMPRVLSALIGETFGTELSSIAVIGSDLKLSDPAQRRELIERVNKGEHIELEIEARTFRQKDGEPNRNFLRFKSERLSSIAESFKGMPMLLDHNKWEQGARKGTIVSSEAELQGHGWTAFKQTLKIVKPDAVVSVLDGTLDRFSIGWHPTGPVLCSVHGVDVRSWKERSKAECYCWPGDKVIVEVDGKKSTQIVEYEFQNADGIEVSAVNVPAVKGTRIEDVREALALELGLQIPAREKDQHVMFKSLATILGLKALATADDEPAAVAAVESLRRELRAAEQERDEARTKLTAAERELEESRTVGLKVAVDAAIEAAYRDGKLRYGRDSEGKAIPSTREDRLRRIAKQDGLKALQAEIAEMQQVVPVGQRALAGGDPVRDRPTVDDNDNLEIVAEQLGYKPDELREYRNKLYGEG